MLSNDVGLSHESAQPVMNSDGPQERKMRRGRKTEERWRRWEEEEEKRGEKTEGEGNMVHSSVCALFKGNNQHLLYILKKKREKKIRVEFLPEPETQPPSN